MTLDDELDTKLYGLGKKLRSRESIVRAVMDEVERRNVKPRKTTLKLGSMREGVLLKYFSIAAAALLAALLTGFFLSDQHSAAAFADQAVAAFADAKILGVRAGERTIVVLNDGTRHQSSSRNVFVCGQDRYRRDIYEGEVLRETQWYTPENIPVDQHSGSGTSTISGMLQTSVRYDSKTFSTQTHQGSFGSEQPIERMSFTVGFVNKAERELPPITINNLKCPGFQIRASLYGSNPPDWIDRIWFDPQTKLPVRIEYERKAADKQLTAIITVDENFEWRPTIAPEAFTPKIPEGFKHD